MSMTAILVMLVCACSVIGIAGVLALARGMNPSGPVSPPSAGAVPTTSGLIAYVGTDGNIYTIAPNGSGKQAVTRDKPADRDLYNTLAWSPDGQLAFVAVTDQSSTLLAIRPGSNERTQVHSGGPDEAPFYLYWSPNGQRIAFLASAQRDGLALWMAESHSANSSQSIASGSPSYFSWSPDSQSLLMHIGGTQSNSKDAQVAIFRPAPSETTKLPDTPGDFQAPAWEPEGQRFLLARQTESQTNELVLAEGDSRRVLASSRTGLVFTWSPKGGRIAFARPNPSTGLLYDSVVVLDLDSQAQRVVARGLIAAFFWSPDGEQLAVLNVDESNQRPQGRVIPARLAAAPAPQSSPVQLVWSVVKITDGMSVDFSPFRPTYSFISLIPYFDQYAQSLSLWSPDSRFLVFADVDERDRPSVRVLDITQPQQSARHLSEGIFAAWSWR
jgi:Tol biopolymer transport system component